jgi:hypothetical protein
LSCSVGIVLAEGNPVPTGDIFYVSPTGDDLNSGTISSPLKTLSVAKNLASLRIQQTNGLGGYLTNNATIYLRSGEYPLLPPANDPLAPGLEILSSETRPRAAITISNAPNEIATVHGAITISANSSAIGYWENAPAFSAYNGGSASNSQPAGMTSISSAKRFVFTGDTRAYLEARRNAMQSQGINGSAFTISSFYGGAPNTTPSRKVRARHPNVRAFNVDTRPFNGASKSDQEPKVSVNVQWFDTDTTASNGYDINAVLNNKTEVVFTRMYETPRAIITNAVINASAIRVEFEFNAMNGNFQYEPTLADVQLNSGVLPSGEETWNRGWAENNKAFLDRAQEWFFDDNEIALYYIPSSGETVESTTYRIPITHSLIELTGTQQVPVDGVKFIGTFVGSTAPTATNPGKMGLRMAWTAWRYENGRGDSNYYSYIQGAYGLSGALDGLHITNTRIERVDFRGIGANAISLGGNRLWYAGLSDRDVYSNQPRGIASNIVVFDNYMTDIGGAGVRIDHCPLLDSGRFWTRPEDATPATSPEDGNLIDDNSILNTGKVFFDSIAVNVLRGIKTSVKSNSITDVPYHGISVGIGCWRVKMNDTGDPQSNSANGERNIIEFNGIVRSMRMLVDGAAIYTGGGSNTRINNNNIVSTAGTRNVEAVTLPAGYNVDYIADIYLDSVSRAVNTYSNPITNSLNRGFTRLQSGNLLDTGISTWLSKSSQAHVMCPRDGEDCCSN